MKLRMTWLLMKIVSKSRVIQPEQLRSLTFSKLHQMNSKYVTSQINQSRHLFISNQTSDKKKLSSRNGSYYPHQKLMKRELRRLLVNNDLIKSEKGIHRKEIKMIMSHLLKTDDNGAEKYIKRKSGRPVASCLMYRTYQKLTRNENDLNKNMCRLHWSDNSHLMENIDLSDTNNYEGLPGQRSSSNAAMFISNLSSDMGDNDSIHKMYEKYKQPSDKKVQKLKNIFPDPVEIFHDVVQPVCDAGLHCHEPVEISSHLNGFYWKAKIQLIWPRRVSVIGKHRDKEQALQRVYLAACEQLMLLGLIVDDGSSVHPASCDDIVNLLEQISEFGDMTHQDSKGKGFKIVLEKTKKQSQHSNLANNFLSYNIINGKMCCEWQMKEYEDTTTIADDAEKAHRGRIRSHWSCSVHVGWPVPFSIRIVALSLPSAQMTALLTAVCNLKMFGLLHNTNKDLDTPALQSAVMRDISRQWHRCISATSRAEHFGVEDVQHCNNDDVDAKIYVDASIVGYGAYLEIENCDKISWLCEPWVNHPHVLSNMYMFWDQKMYLHSSLAELYALASTIFSWKRKLQHLRLVCYSDSQVAVTLISTINNCRKLLPSSSSSQARRPTYPLNHNHNHQSLTAFDNLLDIIQETCITYNIDVQGFWLEREDNSLADTLANCDIQTFKTATPNAASSKTKIKHFPWKHTLL